MFEPSVLFWQKKLLLGKLYKDTDPNSSHPRPLKPPPLAQHGGLTCRRISPKLPAAPRSFWASGVSKGKLCKAKAAFLRDAWRVVWGELTLQETITYPTQREKENHRRKTAF